MVAVSHVESLDFRNKFSQPVCVLARDQRIAAGEKRRKEFMTAKLRLLCLVTVLAGTVGCKPVSTDGTPAGFTSLFNGHDLTGWTYDGSGNWRVEKGLLVYDGQGWKPMPDTISTQNLRTEKEYGDFILLIDWKIAKDGNSGIVLRPDYEDYHEFEEVQVEIWDRMSEFYSSPLGSGGIVTYTVEERKPLQTADHPVGEWNHFEIRLENDMVTVHLNGQLVLDRFAGQFKLPRGPIVLEHHGPPLCFKNIYLKELN